MLRCLDLLIHDKEIQKVRVLGKVHSITQELAEFVAKLSYGDLSRSIVEDTKKHILDTLGVCLCASKTNQKLIKLFSQFFSHSGKCTSFSGTSLSPVDATFVNAFLAHSIEMDDEHRESMTHIGGAVVTSALAMTQHLGKSGRDFVLATALGYELAGRVGEALAPKMVYKRGFHPTCIAVPFGTCAASAKLLGLERNQISNAFGLVSVQCSGLMAGVELGPASWYFQYARAAQSGVLASILASKGIDGPRNVFDDTKDFFNVYSISPTKSALTRNLSGPPSKISHSGFKPYPCCRSIHPGLDLLKEIIETYSLKSTDMQSITYHVPRSTIRLVDNMEFQDSRLSAQTSSQYCFALLLNDKLVLPSGFSKSKLKDRRLIRDAGKVVVRGSYAFDKYLPQKMPGKIVVITREGRTISSEAHYPKGDPENPMTYEEIISKLRTINSNFDQRKIDELIAAVNTVQSSNRVDRIGAIIRDMTRAIPSRSVVRKD